MPDLQITCVDTFMCKTLNVPRTFWYTLFGIFVHALAIRIYEPGVGLQDLPKAGPFRPLPAELHRRPIQKLRPQLEHVGPKTLLVKPYC